MLIAPPPSFLRLLPRLAGAAVGLAFASAACAQYPVGNPRPLDRNPTVGLNGRNPTTATDIGALTRYNNAVVTGNAGYGRAFRGYVGYLAPDDFRASLGTNDLFNYRRDSSAGVQTSQGIRGTDSLRYQFMLSTGQAPPSLLSGTAAAAGAVPIFSRDASAASASTGSALRSTSDYLGIRALQSNIVGYRTDEQGKNYAISASPLLGVTMVPIELPGAARKPADVPLAPGAQPRPDGGPTTPDGRPIPPGAESASKRGDTRSFSGLEATRPGLMSPFAAQQMVDTANAASRVNTRVPAPSAVLDPLKRSLPDDKTAVPPADPAAPPTAAPAKPVWERELDQLRDRLKREELDKKKAERAAPENAATPPGDAQTPSGPGSRKPTTEQKPKPRPAPMTLEEVRELTKDDIEKLDRDVLRALIMNRPKLDHLAPAASTTNYAYDYHMSAGESFLSEGRFFDAEDRFLRALAASPSDPLASIGRSHAQLGAGLYLSAAANLHAVLAEHPEMIGTRYDRALLFSDARCAEIANEMRADLQKPGTMLGRDASLLLAYLGYQRDDRVMLEEGIKAFAGSLLPESEESRPDKALLSLLQRVWVDGEGALPPPPAPDQPGAPQLPRSSPVTPPAPVPAGPGK